MAPSAYQPGCQGDKGNKGAKGDRGEQGKKGEQGEKGALATGQLLGESCKKPYRQILHTKIENKEI